MLDYSYSLSKETRRLSSPRISYESNRDVQSKNEDLKNSYSTYSGTPNHSHFSAGGEYSYFLKPMSAEGRDKKRDRYSTPPTIDLDRVLTETDRFKRRLSQASPLSSSPKEALSPVSPRAVKSYPTSPRMPSDDSRDYFGPK